MSTNTKITGGTTYISGWVNDGGAAYTLSFINAMVYWNDSLSGFDTGTSSTHTIISLINSTFIGLYSSLPNYAPEEVVMNNSIAIGAYFNGTGNSIISHPGDPIPTGTLKNSVLYSLMMWGGESYSTTAIVSNCSFSYIGVESGYQDLAPSIIGYSIFTNYVGFAVTNATVKYSIFINSSISANNPVDYGMLFARDYFTNESSSMDINGNITYSTLLLSMPLNVSINSKGTATSEFSGVTFALTGNISYSNVTYGWPNGYLSQNINGNVSNCIWNANMSTFGYWNSMTRYKANLIQGMPINNGIELSANRSVKNSLITGGGITFADNCTVSNNILNGFNNFEEDGFATYLLHHGTNNIIENNTFGGFNLNYSLIDGTHIGKYAFLGGSNIHPVTTSSLGLTWANIIHNTFLGSPQGNQSNIIDAGFHTVAYNLFENNVSADGPNPDNESFQ